MKPNWMKVVGVVLPLAGAAVSVATSWMDDRKLDDKVAKKVEEALAKNNQ